MYAVGDVREFAGRVLPRGRRGRGAASVRGHAARGLHAQRPLPQHTHPPVQVRLHSKCKYYSYLNYGYNLNSNTSSIYLGSLRHY